MSVAVYLLMTVDEFNIVYALKWHIVDTHIWVSTMCHISLSYPAIVNTVSQGELITYADNQV